MNPRRHCQPVLVHPQHFRGQRRHVGWPIAEDHLARAVCQHLLRRCTLRQLTDPNGHGRPPLTKVCHDACDRTFETMCRGADVEPATRLVGRTDRDVERGRAAASHLPRRPYQRPTCCRQHQTATDTVKQFDSEFALEATNTLRQRRLGDRQILRSRRQGLTTGNGKEVLDLT